MAHMLITGATGPKGTDGRDGRMGATGPKGDDGPTCEYSRTFINRAAGHDELTCWLFSRVNRITIRQLTYYLIVSVNFI